MSGHEVEVEIGRVAGPRRRSSVRSTAMLLAVPVVVVGIAAVAVLGGRPDSTSAPNIIASTSRSPTLTAATARPSRDLAIQVPRGQVPLDFTHRPLPGVEPGLTGTVRAELTGGGTYTLLVRCAGAGEVRWPDGAAGPPSAAGVLPCDGDVHSADLTPAPTDARSAGIDFSFDLAADTHIVVVETRRLTPAGDVVAVPLKPDGSRPGVLGVPTDAITVEAILEDDVYTGLLVRRLSLDGSVATLAVVPASAFPPEATPTLYNGGAAVSRAGFLAVPFETADEAEELAVFDLTDPRAPAAVVGDRATGFGWGPDGQLAVGRAGGIGVYDPITRRVDAVPIAPDLDLGDRYTWTTDGRIAATRATGDAVELGEIRSDGTFLPGTWPLFDPLGIERPRSADGYAAAEALWAADGRSVWLLVTAGEGRARLVSSRSPTSGDVVARFRPRNLAYESPGLVGASADDAAIAIGIEAREVIVVDTRTGTTHRLDGAFAGWADTRGSVYPLPASP